MTVSLKANAAGTQGEILVGATPVAQFPVASGLPFCKNKLFNGEVTRINQRQFDGNWATKNTWASGNTIAQQELCYGYDMWAKASATDMVQVIEAGNFSPATVHTISGNNMTTRQETSPASGNWNIVVPQAARNIQVEEGAVATPFEIRPISFELAQCQRYYQLYAIFEFKAAPVAGQPTSTTTPYRYSMRTIPAVTFSASWGTGFAVTPFNGMFQIAAFPDSTGSWALTNLCLSAVI